jgi:hypothetical protein
MGLRDPRTVASKCSKLLELSRKADIPLTGILVEEHVEHVAEKHYICYPSCQCLRDKIECPN